ncbi:MAG: hypothetical protein OXR66_05645 [Candidatus Woesearchaeota archaeon]|nr:hypothetical protein [Candidatus Woesearchaeota archaeon]
MRFLIALLFLPSLVAAAPALSVEKISYEYGEQVHAIACGDDPSLAVSCLNGKILEEQWSSACTIFLFDSYDLTCQKPMLRAYDETGATEQTLVIRQDKKIVEHAVKENTTDPYEIAVQIYAFSLLEDEGEIEKLLDVLKEQRDDDEKCWPSDACSIATTIDIAYLLHFAEINRSKRVYDDALLWIESHQNRVIEDAWYAEIRADETTACVLNIDGGTTSFALDDTELNTVDVTYTTDAYLNLSCDDSFCIEVFDSFDRAVFEDCGDQNSNSSFKMYGPCWSSSKWSECDPRLTAKALLLDGLSTEAYDEGRTWINEHIVTAGTGGSHIEQSQNVLTNTYIYNVTQDADILKWVLHAQNNDGSFGETSEMILSTLEATRILTSLKEEEWISDAIEWLSLIRPSTGWNDLLHDTLQFNVFITEHPFLRTKPQLIGDGQFSLLSSKPYGVQYNLSQSLQDIITVDAPALVNNSKGKVRLITTNDGVYTGYIIAYNESFMQHLPVRIERTPTFALDFKETHYLFENPGQLSVPIQKSSSLLDCAFWFDEFFMNNSHEILDAASIRFKYELPNDAEETIHGGYTCASPLGVLEDTFSFNVKTFSNPPFSHEIDTTSINETPAKLTIKNELNEPIPVRLSWLKDASVYPVAPQYTVKDTAVIYLYQQEPSVLNITERNTLRIEAFGYTEKIPLLITLDDTPHELPKPKIWLKVLLSILGIVVLGAMCTILVKQYRLKKEEERVKKEQEQQEKEQKKRKKRRKPPKPKKPKSLVEVAIAIQRSMGKKDEQILKDLLEKGYKKSEVTPAMKGLVKDTKRVEKERKEEKAAEEEKKAAEEEKHSEEEKKD